MAFWVEVRFLTSTGAGRAEREDPLTEHRCAPTKPCAALRTDSPALPPTSCRREIITLQLGPYANWVGAHFWNIQDESLHPALDEHGDPVHDEDDADPSVLYRAGSSQGQPTTTPRLVVCDLPDALEDVRREFRGKGRRARGGADARVGVEQEATHDLVGNGSEVFSAHG